MINCCLNCRTFIIILYSDGDKYIKKYYSSEDIGSIFKRFTACNFNPSQYYEEGNLWQPNPAISPILTHDTTTYPDQMTSTLDYLAAEYRLFIPIVTNNDNILRISVDGTAGRWGIKVQKKRRADNTCYVQEIKIDNQNNYRTVVDLSNFGNTFKEICVIPSNLQNNGANMSLNITAEIH